MELVVCLPSDPTFLISLPQYYRVANKQGWVQIGIEFVLGVLCQFHKPKGEWTDRPVSKQLCLGIWIFGLWVVVT